MGYGTPSDGRSCTRSASASSTRRSSRSLFGRPGARMCQRSCSSGRRALGVPGRLRSAGTDHAAASAVADQAMRLHSAPTSERRCRAGMGDPGGRRAGDRQTGGRMRTEAAGGYARRSARSGSVGAPVPGDGAALGIDVRRRRRCLRETRGAPTGPGTRRRRAGRSGYRRSARSRSATERAIVASGRGGRTSSRGGHRRPR